MNVNVGRCTVLGLTAGVIPSIVLKNPKTESGEKAQNKARTATGAALIAAAPFAAKEIVSRNPQAAQKVFEKTGTIIEKGLKYVAEKAPQVLEKVTETKAGGAFVSKILKGAAKFVEVIKNSKVSNVAEKAAQYVSDFTKLPAAKKGKIGLIVAGVALLATAANKLFKNHYKNEGKIEQKYDDLREKYERMTKYAPVIDGDTNEVITFDDFCKMAQTYLK